MADGMAGAASPAGGIGRCRIVVPCYNEANRLQPGRFSEFLAADAQVCFLFVNDGSRDNTLEILECLRAEHPLRVQVLDVQPNGGKAEAVRRGMVSAIAGGAAITGFWDADLATPLGAIPRLLQVLVEQPESDMVFGARVRLLGHDIRRKPIRHYLGRCFATVASTLLRLPVYDTQCGAKLFRVTPALAQVLAQPFSSRWIFDVEIIARFIALHHGDRGYAQHAIYEKALQSWQDVAGSKVGPLDFFRAFYELLSIYKKYLRS